MFGNWRTRTLERQIESLSMQLASVVGELGEKTSRLGLADSYEMLKKELTDLQIEKERTREAHEREKREIEHKLGLHKLQVEEERKAAIKEAQLAVREEALQAQEGRFKQEMEFMQQRFEQEVQSQRKLVEQVLDRLPKFERTYSTVEHIGKDPNPPARLELTDGAE